MKNTVFYRSLFVLPALFLISFLAYSQDNGEAVLGHWYNTEKDAKIEIYQCEGKFCGKVVWLEEPNDENGEEKRDTENPKLELQTNTILGLNLLRDFKYAGENEWEGGKIYDPKNGKTYSCVMKLQENGELEVRGYVGFTLLGRTVHWTSAD